MASTGIFELVYYTTTAAADVLVAVDTGDPTQSPQGSTKAITIENFFGAIPTPVAIRPTGDATALPLHIVSSVAQPVVLLDNGTGPNYLEFTRSPYTVRGSVGALGNFEMNLSYNMNYVTTVHRLYDQSVSATWLAVNAAGTYLQYAPATIASGDVWQAGGYLYNLEIAGGTGGVTLRGSLKVGDCSGTGDPSPPNASYGLEIKNPPLSGVNQYGLVANPKFSSGATTAGRAMFAQVITAAASYTMASGVGLSINDADIGAGSAITTLYGIKIEGQTAGGTNYALYTGAGAVSFGDVVEFRAAATARSGSTVGLGGATQTTIGANGGASALTLLPLGYLIGFIGSTKIIIPYYNG